MAHEGKVCWGILGAGNIALSAIAPAIRHSSNGLLWGVASREPARAERLARSTEARTAHSSYDALLDDDRIDAVYIGLPNGLHETWVTRAAAAGKHVLCDKSLALDLEAAQRMRAACVAAGVRLMEGFMYRHHPQWDVVRKLLADGSLGRLRTLHGWLSGSVPEADHRWSAELGGGALFDVTSYGINMARLLVAEEPSQVAAVADLRGAVDRSSLVTMRFPSGVLATAEGSLAAATSQGLRVVTERGELWVQKPVVTGFASTTISVLRGGRSEQLTVAGANHYLHQVEHFAACVLDPARPLGPAEDGVDNVAVCHAARLHFPRS